MIDSPCFKNEVKLAIDGLVHLGTEYFGVSEHAIASFEAFDEFDDEGVAVVVGLLKRASGTLCHSELSGSESPDA